MMYGEKKAGTCTRCGVQLLKPPEHKGGPWFPADSVRVTFETKGGEGISADFCGRCDDKFAPREYKRLERCLVESISDGIDRARNVEINELAHSLSRPNREFSVERCKQLVDQGTLQLKRWSNETTKVRKAMNSNLSIKGVHVREKHNDLGPPMMVAH